MENIVKKALAVLVIMFFAGALSACGSEEGETEEISSQEGNLDTYDGDGFTIDIDPTWEIVGESDFYDQVPDEVSVGFVSPEEYDDFTLAVSVLKEELPQQTDPVEYAKFNINQASQLLVDYQKYEEKQVELDGSAATIHVYEARINPTEKLIRYIQLYTTKDQTGYIVSGGMPNTTPDDLREQVGQMILSFRLK